MFSKSSSSCFAATRSLMLRRSSSRPVTRFAGRTRFMSSCSQRGSSNSMFRFRDPCVQRSVHPHGQWIRVPRPTICEKRISERVGRRIIIAEIAGSS